MRLHIYIYFLALKRMDLWFSLDSLADNNFKEIYFVARSR